MGPICYAHLLVCVCEWLNLIKFMLCTLLTITSMWHIPHWLYTVHSWAWLTQLLTKLRLTVNAKYSYIFRHGVFHNVSIGRLVCATEFPLTTSLPFGSRMRFSFSLFPIGYVRHADWRWLAMNANSRSYSGMSSDRRTFLAMYRINHFPNGRHYRLACEYIELIEYHQTAAPGVRVHVLVFNVYGTTASQAKVCSMLLGIVQTTNICLVSTRNH